MATIGNFQEASTDAVWGGNYEPYGQPVANRIYPGETCIEREMIMNNLYGNNAIRIEDLENKVRELSTRIMELEGLLWGKYGNVLERLDALEKSAGFSYVDLNKG